MDTQSATTDLLPTGDMRSYDLIAELILQCRIRK